jgi:hypothetical protein
MRQNLLRDKRFSMFQARRPTVFRTSTKSSPIGTKSNQKKTSSSLHKDTTLFEPGFI